MFHTHVDIAQDLGRGIRTSSNPGAQPEDPVLRMIGAQALDALTASIAFPVNLHSECGCFPATIHWSYISRSDKWARCVVLDRADLLAYLAGTCAFSPNQQVRRSSLLALDVHVGIASKQLLLRWHFVLMGSHNGLAQQCLQPTI